MPILIIILLFVFSGCTNFSANRKPDGELKIVYSSIGKDFKGINLDLDKTSNTEYKLELSADEANASNSVDRVITGLETLLESLKAVRP